MTASIPIGIGSLAGALLFYIWQKPSPAAIPAAPSAPALTGEICLIYSCAVRASSTIP
jgi:hypothetical protein